MEGPYTQGLPCLPGVQEKLKSRLPEVATHTSKQERIATEAERETTLIKEIEYYGQMYKIPNRYIHYNMEGATLWLKNLANFCCSLQQ